MVDIGFLYNCSIRTNPGVRISPSLLNRVALIDAFLRDAGHRLFFYSPKQIRPETESLLGYRFDNGRFIPATAPIPSVNGNWTYQTRRLLEKGMGYQAFVDWAEQKDVRVYVPPSFSELVGNKYETYALVRGYDASLHPHCEVYRYSARQLRHFADNGRLTFFKPLGGNKGDRIATLRGNGKDLSVTYYEKGKREQFSAADIRAANRMLRKILRGSDRYLIQEGVEALRYGKSVFDIRVIMLYDGRVWNWLHEARLSATDTELSNVSQGGRSVATEDLLFDVFGAESAQIMLDELKTEAYGLASYLERLHPGELMEIAFDFVIDKDARLRLLEINTKPGLVGIGFERTIYDKRPDEEPLFERWVVPHARSLASFLQSKAEMH